MFGKGTRNATLIIPIGGENNNERLKKYYIKNNPNNNAVFLVIAFNASTVCAANYPTLFFYEDPDYENLVISTNAEAGEVVTIRMLWFAAYNNEGYDMAVYNSNGNIVATASNTFTNISGSRKIAVNWDTAGYASGEYKVVVTKKFYSFNRWNEAPTTSSLNIELGHFVHKWNGNYTVDKEATCTEEGSESIHCSVCDVIDETTVRSIEKKAHTFGEWYITKKPTAEAEGERENLLSVWYERNRTSR